MKKSKFTDEQIVGVLKEAESGTLVPDVCRKHGISTYTYYKWCRQYAGLDIKEIRKMRELEAENAKLKRIVANQALDVLALKEKFSGSALGPVFSSACASRAYLVSFRCPL